MKYLEKTIAIIVILYFILSFLCKLSLAQFEATGSFLGNPSFENKPLQVPSWQDQTKGEGSLLIDNFEYWDSPYNHGWKQMMPLYPVFGFGVGYTSILNTVLDLQEGSRVLEVVRPSYIYLLGTTYEKHSISHELYSPPPLGGSSSLNYVSLVEIPVLSFKFKTPFNLEPWEMFEFDVSCSNALEHEVIIKIKPLEPPPSYESTDCDYNPIVIEYNDNPYRPSMTVQINIGRNYIDGTWHVIWLNLPEMVKIAVNNYNKINEANKSNWYITKAKKILISGVMFRLDNIIFRKEDYSKFSKNVRVDVFEPGPLYAQIFEPYRYILMADYIANDEISNVNDFLLDQNNFIFDPNQIRDTWIADLLEIDPNYHYIDSDHSLYDPEYIKRWIPEDPNFGKPDPVAEVYLRKGFFIDITLPLFADRHFRINGNGSVNLCRHGRLGWNITIGGFGRYAIDAIIVKPLSIDPYDGMPSYIMNRISALKSIEIFGKAHFGPEQSLALESALWNSGVEFWPHIAYFDYTPQYFEDLTLALEVSNQNKVEKLVIPVSVVNYPVENYPPEVQSKIFPRIFEIGEETECVILSLDPDCFIFSMAQFYGKTPATTHLPMLPGNKIRTDQDSLFYQMYIEGTHSYQFGPWIECGVDSKSGVGRLIPRFEGILRTVTTCTDVYGASDIGRRNIHCVNPGTWFNHPPVVTSLPNPRVIRAGEEIVLNARAEDPDGDEVYASCNFGSIGQVANGDTIWTFQTNFPGIYSLEIVFFDIRGGYALANTSIEVVPWWSY